MQRLGTVRLLRPEVGGRGGERGGEGTISKRLDFENAQNVRGIEMLTHRAGLLCRVKVVKQYYD